MYSVMVGNVVASGGISLTAGNLTIANGSTGSTQITVTPSGGYNGRIVWSLSVTGSSNTSSSLTACYAIDPLLVNSISTTNLTIGIGTACESPQPAGRAALRTLTQRALPNGKTRANWRSTPITGAGGANNTGTSIPTPSATTYSLALTGTDSVNQSIVGSTTFILTVH
jgi:hypothetical protein